MIVHALEGKSKGENKAHRQADHKPSAVVLIGSVRLNIADHVPNRRQTFGNFIRDFNAELLFQFHSEFDEVKRIHTKIVDERRVERHVIGGDA